jgi:Uma2 family endonuclease
MSTVEHARPKMSLPPLKDGERLDQPTFHKRYEAMPPNTRAELVGGVVYMPSPMSLDHGDESRNVAGWLFHFQWKTPGVEGGDGATAKLFEQSEPQPDHHLRIPAALGGHTHVDAGGYLAGPPELIVEIARSSRSFDLREKKADYDRAGVLEYVVVEIDPNRIHWFVCSGTRFKKHAPGADGIYRSKTFPGLWLDAEALYAGDRDRLIAVLEQGLASPEHAAFIAKLAKASRGGRNAK